MPHGHHTFRIKAGVSTVDSSIEMDGKPLDGVTRVAFDLNPRGLTILRLEIMGEVLVDGEFRESALVKVEQINPDYRGK